MYVPIVIFAACCIIAHGKPLETNLTLHTREGTQKNVQIFINHHLLRMNLDGIVNGTQTGESSETVWHRISQSDGILLRSSLYCNYACINECGYGYSALIPNNECLWTEQYDEHNYRFINKKFGNRTAYLSINLEGKLKRTVLLRKETLGNKFEQSHVTLKDYDGEALNVTCKPVNYKKISYQPIKTCKNPPRPKKGLKREVEDKDDDEVEPKGPINTGGGALPTMTVPLIGMADMINNTIVSQVPLNTTDNIIKTNMVPVMHNEVIELEEKEESNKTFTYEIDPNKRYYKEIIEIKPLDSVNRTTNVITERTIIKTTEITESTMIVDDPATQALVDEILRFNGTSSALPKTHEEVFGIVKLSTSRKCSMYVFN
ncbi:FGF [Mamestra configurata nucleopolyhedrovirus A]|uniref:FGF n=2 Tax=Mamestra configurata nucleopolyhedrovirus TaxID=207830 RepID=Q8QLI3_NPVMC|nr:fibroblast growth factor FGF [Mamestra configurata nucleopolyhedrovirus A]UVZ34885.1 FGF [Melanchra picta nucleopolyhedrovirus]AAM09159.1 fibroblast growth factor FGF [Mamestra configurata nucleopolyhedrovirus A]AAQ11070.1 FGF [Mamestra configurata nucleopolyhedrovirus A]QNH90862.1 fgf [Mamestra configurata nucleopolyhedrovirus A]UVZ35056.1 FGF [Melanchra picta nucleopolyhedrovirus]